MRSGWLLATALFCGCTGNHAPVLQPIADQTAAVGVELSIELRATDADGDSLSFDFDAPGLSDIKSRAQISAFADNVAIFRWTPDSADAADTPYAFDFKVTDGKATATETVQITVGGMGGSVPVFRQPLGTGTTLDLSTATCIDVGIEVEDTGATQVTLSEDDPQIDGSMLTQNDAFTGTWHWCPTAMQQTAQDRYLLHLRADDGNNASTKDYLIVLRSMPATNCPGDPPVIMHTPPDAQSTVLDIQITAEITDDLGIKAAPLLYYSTTQPGTPPDLTMMQQVAMTLSGGDALDGMYSGTIPNPVASSPSGTTKTLYYLIEAKDNDDPNGTCDHVVDEPPGDVDSVDVTNPGSTGTLMACAACTADSQCATGFDCIHVGSGSGTFCAKECTGTPPCASGYSCSSAATPITSVGGKLARFCRPSSLSCAPTCTDDTLEENDMRTNIVNSMSANLTPMAYTNLVLCADGTNFDEDFYALTISSAAIVTAEMKIKNYVTGGSHADLDLFLEDKNGTDLTFSDGVTTTEYLAACVPASSQKVFLDVITFDSAPVSSKYDLTVTRTGPDANEAVGDNDATTQVPLTPGATFNQNICGSEDWFWTYLMDGTPLVVDLKFTARVDNEQLDVRLMRDNNSAPTQVATSTAITGGLEINYTAPTGGEDFYYVVVSAKSATNGGNSYTLTPVQAPPLQ